MPSAAARIDTDRPSQYLVHLCRHATKMSHTTGRLHGHAGEERPEIRDVTWTDSDGTLSMSWGTCILHAEDGTLTVHVEADDDADLKRVQDIIAGDLQRFGRRDQLRVDWTRVDTPPAHTG